MYRVVGNLKTFSFQSLFISCMQYEPIRLSVHLYLVIKAATVFLDCC